MQKRKLGRLRQDLEDGVRAKTRKLGYGRRIVIPVEAYKPSISTRVISAGPQTLWKIPRDEVAELADRLANLTLENKPLTSFTCFRRLPPELRLTIWKFARPDARIVRLAWSQWDDDEEGVRSVYSSTPIPAMLHTCFEARKVALKWYRLAFHLHHGKNRRQRCHTYFDFSSDYLYTGCENCNAYSCEKCDAFLRLGGMNDVTRVLVRLDTRDRAPFFNIALWRPSTTELLFMGRCQPALKPGTSISELREVQEAFEWQDGKKMEEILLEEKKEVFSIGIHSMVGWNPARIARVEHVDFPEKEEEL